MPGSSLEPFDNNAIILLAELTDQLIYKLIEIFARTN